MRLTRRQKVGLSVLGVGLAALVFDRTVLFSGGRSAMAATPDVVPQPPSASGPAQTPRAHKRDDGALAGRLTDLRQSLGYQPGTLPDAFVRPASWTPPPSPATGEDPAPSHVLSSVVSGGEGEGMAMIDGQPYRVGQSRNGLRLINVDQRSAVVEASGRTFRLYLAEPDLGR